MCCSNSGKRGNDRFQDYFSDEDDYFDNES